jgi:hypothetical protein
MEKMTASFPCALLWSQESTEPIFSRFYYEMSTQKQQKKGEDCALAVWRLERKRIEAPKQ